MAKLIKLTAECITEAVEAFKKALTTGKFSDGEATFTKKLGDIKDRKAKVIYKEIAWLKQNALVEQWDKEVAWHGIAKRGEGDTYIIEDILVYPQEVTGVTVTTDQEEYETWLMNHDDDTFNNIRMQGHSHVNMPTSPSGVDTSLYERILQQLDDTMFYIFMIWNKRGEKTIKIYDMSKNIFFDTKDCEVVIDEDIGIQSFLKSAQELVKDKPAVTTVTTKYNNYAGYSGCYQYQNEIYTPTYVSAKEENKKGDKKEKKEEKRKGKRKEKADKYEYTAVDYDPWKKYKV